MHEKALYFVMFIEESSHCAQELVRSKMSYESEFSLSQQEQLKELPQQVGVEVEVRNHTEEQFYAPVSGTFDTKAKTVEILLMLQQHFSEVLIIFIN